MSKAKVTNLRKHYPELSPDKGVLEWPAMRRLADRLDPSYKV